MEKTEYAVLRFVEQNNYCHMVHDYVQGHSIMEYAKENIKLDKKRVFTFAKELAKQMEQFYRCESDEAYGAVNPYAVIVTEHDSVVLLDVWAEDNKEIMAKMQKKKVRALFVTPEYVLSQKKRREDDLYGFGRTIHFFVEHCCGKNVFTYKEEKMLQRLYEKCGKGEKADIGKWKGIQKTLDKILQEKKENIWYRRYLKGMVLFLVAFLGGAYIGGQMEPGKQETVISEGEKIDEFENEKANAYLEIGIWYLVKEKEEADIWLDRAAESLEEAKRYHKLYEYLQKEVLKEEEKEYVWELLREEKTELEKKDDLYKTVYLRSCKMLDDSIAWKEVIRVGNTVEQMTEEIKEYMAEAYENLENYEAAILEYEELKLSYSAGTELRMVYEKLMKLYHLTGMEEKVKENYEEAVEQMPKLKTDEDFLKWKEEYGIDSEENVLGDDVQEEQFVMEEITP